MLKVRTLGTMLALGALTALPACSMFGSGEGGSSQYRQSSYNTGAYNAGPSQRAAMQPAQPGTNVTQQAAITPHMIRAVQHKLRNDHLYSARVDGVWGPMTERGVREWQQQHNVNATGQLDMSTLQAMNISTGNTEQYGQSNGTRTNPGQNAANQPNYSTAGNRANGSNYSNNMPNTGNMNNASPNQTNPTTQPANTANGNGGAGNSGNAQSGR